MAEQYTKKYDGLPFIVRLLLQIFFGYLISGIYRIVRYTETKNIITLVVGIVALLTGIGNAIAWILDLITLITDGKPTILVD